MVNAWRLNCMRSHILCCRIDTRAPIANPGRLDLPATEGSQPAALHATAALTLPLPLPPLQLAHPLPLPLKALLLPLLPLQQPATPLPTLCRWRAGSPSLPRPRLLCC